MEPSLGSGVGKGGGSGGTVREVGGSMGTRGATQEDQYFQQKDKEKIQALKKEKEAKEASEQEKK